jgi:hypothetical protein
VTFAAFNRSSLLLLLFLWSVSSSAQNSSASQRLLEASIEAFSPVRNVQLMWGNVFEEAARAEADIRKRIDSLERCGAPELEVVAQVGDWQREIKAVREQRDAFVRATLTEAMQLKYDSLRSPARPSVMHFGMHDRLLCGLCKKPGALGAPISTQPKE